MQILKYLTPIEKRKQLMETKSNFCFLSFTNVYFSYYTIIKIGK